MTVHVRPTEAELGAAVAEAARSVLETMFFAEVEACAPLTAEQQQNMTGVAVQFDGGMRGEFLIGFDPRVAGVLASGFLGADEADVSPAEVEQVLCETANMICGAALSHIEAEDHMRLGTPGPADAASGFASGGWLQEFFVTPDGNIVTGVRLG
ncbi:MAG TPA: chemotaxis protein CheX [Bryobacteraceae bacterium]|nr:chemotaxis protein CheX [Bryobacteraceae bacterium]